MDKNDKSNWHNNWYNNRKEILKNNRKEILKTLGINIIKDNIENEIKNKYINNINNTKEKIINITDPNTTGIYNKKENIIYYDNNSNDSDKIHERTHATNADDQIALISNKQIYPKDIRNHNEYLDNAEEIYARLMEVRYNNKINPNKKLTIDDIKELKNKGKDQNILNRYDDDILLLLFNEIAQNNNNNNNNNNTKNLNIAKMGINKKQLYPNIVRGGMAIPLGNNYYFMKGRKHTQGGIDVGKDLEVEGGEIMKLDKNNVKVFSAVPFLNGRSPVEMVLGGENPNKVFAQQERFKKVNKINDDGTKVKYRSKMNRQKAPFGILKNLGEIFGFSKKDDKPKETSKPKKTNKPISKIHIGGTPNEARQKYYDLDTEFADSVKAVSKRYGLNPNLVASRLAKEGPVDHNIKLSNDGYRFIRDVVFGPQWGLDDLGNHIKEGKVNIKESWNNIDVDDSFVNEKGRLTNTVYSPNWVDGVYGTAAELKYRRDYMKKHFPKMTEEQLDAAAAASFNRGNAGARKWINRGGNYMQYKPFIKLKQLGGKANIYRLDSNGKSGLRMNISTGDETKARKKALLGTGYEIINNKLHYYGVPVNEINKTYQQPELTLNNFNNKYKGNYEFTDKGLEYKPYRSNVLNVPKLNFNVKHDNKKTINWNKIGTTIKPYAGSIIDTVGNIATSLINASTLNKMRYSKQPIPQIANKLKTSVNINPQLKTLNESYNQYTDYINNNTASSKVAREALQRARIKNVLDTNTLYATKENAETELINKDRINQQTVANANVDNYNKWLVGKAEFDNAILDKKSENIVGAINNITSSFNTSINNIKKDRQFNNNLISVLAANPNVNPEYLRALGADWVTDKMIEDWKLANKKK